MHWNHWLTQIWFLFEQQTGRLFIQLEELALDSVFRNVASNDRQDDEVENGQSAISLTSIDINCALQLVKIL